MAAFYAELQVDGKTFAIDTASYGLYQPTDESGNPASGVRTHAIRLQLAGSDDETLSAWAADPYKRLDGTLTFYRIDGQGRFREVRFEQAYCVRYAERLAATRNASGHETGTSYQIELTISPMNLKIGNTEHKNQWP